MRVTTLLDVDLGAVAAIAATAPDRWRREDLAAALADPARLCLAVWQGEALGGFACFRLHTPDAELEMVAVRPDLRGKGLAPALLLHGLDILRKEGATRCLLEVRAGNTPALALYKRLGFAALARRPGMYSHPIEDGWLMELKL